MKLLVIGAIQFSAIIAASALDRVEARPGGASMRGHMSGATDFQFGVHVSGTLDQKIGQLDRELRLLRFSRDDFPALASKVSYAGTNRPMSQCLADLSKKVGKAIPMELGTNDFKTKEFVFEKITLLDALKYLVAFDEAILDTRDGKLVSRPVREALAMDEPEYKLLRLMARQRFQEVEQFLAQGPLDVQRIKDQDGQTLLHLAVWKNQTAIAARLIALGTIINAKDNVGHTPLHEAVRRGSRECVELLLKNGADPAIPDNNNATALQTAIYFGHLDLARMLAARGAPVDIFTASGLGMTERVKRMLDEGVDFRKEQHEYLKLHLPEGVGFTGLRDPIRRMPGSYFGVHGVSPLHWAARGGSVEVASLLVSRGELVDAVNANGETPLFWAVANGQARVVEFLVKHGAAVNATNAFGSTPLLASARETDSPEQMKLLIEAGANVNARDSGGENALHKLAWFGYPKKNIETAQCLLAAGADITVKNKDGKTPLDILLANTFQNSDLVELYRRTTTEKSRKR